MQLVQIAPPPLGAAEPGDCIRTFVFCANLAAQEACGDAAASTTTHRVLQGLRGSSEYRGYLFGVVAHPPTLGEVSSLGFVSVPAAAPSPELDCEGFINISLPLKEDTSTAEIELVFAPEYLPLPGEEFDPDARELALWMARTALDLVRRLGRDIAQVGLLHPPGLSPQKDALAGVYAELGFELRHSEQQLVSEIASNPVTPLITPGLSAQVWPDYDIPERYLDDVTRLLTLATADSHHGKLTVAPQPWDRERLAQARSRIRVRRAHTLLAAVLDSDGQVLALTELARQEDADPQVCEWTLTVSDRSYRGRGLAMLAKLVALHKVNAYWPHVRRAYFSLAAEDKAMAAIYAHLGAKVISQASAWEKKLR